MAAGCDSNRTGLGMVKDSIKLTRFLLKLRDIV